MTHLTRRAASLLVPLIVVALVPLGCGDEDSNGMGPGGSLSNIAGTWTATSFAVDGTEVITGGTTFAITIRTDGTFSTSATNDAGANFCDSGMSSCSDGGTVSATSSTLTLDAGTIDELTLNYSVSGNTMTLSGMQDGSTLAASFTKTG